MKFLLDHDVPDDMSYSLESLGHEVVKLREILPGASPDENVLGMRPRAVASSLPATGTTLSGSLPA